MASKFSLVTLSWNLAKEKSLTELKNDVIAELNKITNNNDSATLGKFKLNTEFTGHILSLVHGGFKDKKLNEFLISDVVVEISSKLHNWSENEKNLIPKQEMPLLQMLLMLLLM